MISSRSRRCHRFLTWASLVLLIAAVGVAGFTAEGSAAARIVLRAADNQPPDYPTVMGLKFMAEYVKARSNGRIEIQVFPGGQLGDERSAIEQTQLGVIDIVRTSTAPVEAFYKPMGVYSLPYIFRSESHMWNVVQGAIGRELLDGLKQANLVGLAYYDSGSRNFYTTKKPIRSPADMKGLRIRVQQSQVFIDLLQTLGASAVPMAFGEVYTSLQTGVIDGAENNFPSYGPFGVRHYEVAPYFTLDGHSRVPEVVMIGLNTWNRLSPEDQALIREAAQASVIYQATLWDNLVERSRKAVEEAGSTIIDVDVAAFQKAVAPLYDKYRPIFGDLIDRILNTPD